MASEEQMMTAGRELRERQPTTTDEQLRAYLEREFLVARDGQVTLLRIGLWPLALLFGLFRRSSRKTAEQVQQNINQVVQQLRAEQQVDGAGN